MGKPNSSALITQCSTFYTRRCRSLRGTAMVETAIVMPVYMLVLLGLLYFGYATLHRQRAVKAVALEAWMPGEQTSDDLVSAFWRGHAPQDLTLNAATSSSQYDDYYGNEITSQLVSGSLAGGGQPDTFGRERLAVSLWNYALGETTQSFVWDPVSGIQEVTNTNWDSVANYLNPLAGGAAHGGGFIAADYANPPDIDSHIGWISSAFNGPGWSHWLERRHATLDATYNPTYLPKVSDESARTWEFTMDLTGRTEGVQRLAAGEGGDVLGDVGDLFGGSLPDVNDATSNLWTRW